MPVLRRFPVRAWRVLVLAGIALHVVLALSGAVESIWPQRLMALLVVLCAAGAAVAAVVERRALWAALAAGIGLWAVGDAYFTLAVAGDPVQEFPSLADALWLLSYVPLFVAVMLVIRDSVVGWDPGLWLDGLIAAVGTAALGAIIVLPAVDTSTADGLALTVTLSYPVLDVLLLGAVAGGWVITGGSAARTWRLLAAGLVALVITDIAFVVQVAAGTYHSGIATDAGWPLAFLILASTAWAGHDLQPVRRLRSSRVPLVPIACSAGGILLIAVDHYVPLDGLGIWLALVTLTLGLARTTLAFRSNVRLQDSAHQAITDELTGLGNRRRLLRDLEALLTDTDDRATLALFDLDGFKAYNDAYGHPAGDALLGALGERLRTAVGAQGRAYRLGGDEFCVLVTTTRVEHDLVLQRSLDALRQEGTGFAIEASHGTVALPGEAALPVEALQLADTRMYARKDARRSSTRRQSRDLLLQILHEQQPDLEEHSADVGGLVVAVGRRLRLDEATLEHTLHAAELHDVGKVAIPEAILRKPAPLDEEEWALMRRHTVIGERILGSVPALIPVGRIVRSTHERWDGTGYPDRLRGEEIPLGARIVAVCDSFHAITTDRPYRAGRGVDQAVAELRRCAGTQFDPTVVEAFAAEIEAGALEGAADAPQAGRTRQAARQMAPAGSVASVAAGELATLAQLRGLMHAKELARGGADVVEVLEAISATIASSLGFRTVAVNLFRPEWDDVVTTAVVGSDEVRALLLGASEPADSWRPLLDARYERAGAYLVPHGEVDWDTFGLTHIPDMPASEEGDAWHPEDGLFVPLTSASGELLGIVSVDEPVWGRRPTDAELEVLVAVCDHAALAVELARQQAATRRRERADARAAGLARDLVVAWDDAEVATALRSAVREGLGFGSVTVDRVTDAASGLALEALLARGEAGEDDVVLLAGDAAADARAWRGSGPSVHNGRGPHAWSDHLLAAPLRGEAGKLLAVVWADDPADRRLPGAGLTGVMGRMAGLAAVALVAARRRAGDDGTPVAAPDAAEAA